MRTKILLVFAGVLIALTLSESVLRLSSAIVRNPQNAAAFPDMGQDVFVIVCLGDSVTYGVGDPAGQGYPKNLEAILSARMNKKVIVINKGIPGASTTTVLNELNDAIKKIPHIDLVVILTGNGNSIWNLQGMFHDLRSIPLSSTDRMLLRLDNFLSKSRVFII